MSRSGHRFVEGALGSAFLALASCSLFVDTDGLSGGSALTNDGGPTANDASSVDSSSFDAATLDAGADIDAAPLAYCAAHPGHALCLDFDESTSVPLSDNDDYDATRLTIDSTTSASAPNSVRTLFPPGSSNQGLEYDYMETGKVSFSFDLRIDAGDITEGQVIAVGVDLPDGDGVTQHSFYVESYRGDFHLAESWFDGTTTQYWDVGTLVASMPNATWLHVDLAIEGSTGAMTGNVDGTPVSGTASHKFPSGAMDFGFGGYAQDFGSDTTLHLDDVVFDP